jgi:hypothetical protein
VLRPVFRIRLLFRCSINLQRGIAVAIAALLTLEPLSRPSLYAMPLDSHIHTLFYNKAACERSENKWQFEGKYRRIAGHPFGPPGRLSYHTQKQ